MSLSQALPPQTDPNPAFTLHYMKHFHPITTCLKPHTSGLPPACQLPNDVFTHMQYMGYYHITEAFIWDICRFFLYLVLHQPWGKSCLLTSGLLSRTFCHFAIHLSLPILPVTKCSVCTLPV